MRPLIFSIWAGFIPLTCGPSALTPSTPPSGQPSTTSAPVREVRVLVASNVEGVRIHRGRLRELGDDLSAPFRSHSEEAIEIKPRGIGDLDADGDLKGGSVVVIPIAEAPLGLSTSEESGWSVETRYAGKLAVTRASDGSIDVVNHVDLEDYVAGVVAGEVWPTFADETYRVQAVVSRTYVLYQMQQSRGGPYDVSATQGSQVYRGLRNDTTGIRAQKATEATRGIVCTFHQNGDDRLFCTYYEASCGGMSQSAAIFGPRSDVAPLAGGVACDYCKIAPPDTYRWGPVRIAKRDVMARLVQRFPEVEDLIELTDIIPVNRTPDGRIVSLRLVGTSGATLEVQAERFRFAVGPSVMRSTACGIRVATQEVVLENGRGFGHGLGLCQWGAEGQAQQGKRASEILQYYYPGSRLTRVY